MRNTALRKNIENASPESGELFFWWLGQMGYVLKSKNVTVLIDGYISPRSTRQFPPSFEPCELPKVDYVLGSHGHDDHIDGLLWKWYCENLPSVRFVASHPAGIRASELMNIPKDRMIMLRDGEEYRNSQLRIRAVAAAHELLSPDPETGFPPCLSFLLEMDGLLVCHIGDACLYEGYPASLRKWGRPDVLFLPINGRDAARLNRGCIGNMTWQEAADLAGSLRPGLTVPGHFDMFADNSADPWAFASYFEIKYPDLSFWIGGHGVRVPYRTKENGSC